MIKFLRRLFKSDHLISDGYLYVDISRMKLLSDKLSPNKRQIKIADWDFKVSYKGVSAGGKQAGVIRDLYLHEQVETLRASLIKSNRMQSNQKCNALLLSDNSNMFFDLSIKATRVFIPDKSNRSQGIFLWLSQLGNEGENKACRLILLEDSNSSTKEQGSVISSYSSFYMLASNYKESFAKTVLYNSFDRFSIDDDILAKEFGVSPVDALRKYGAKILPSRDIKVLFKIRSACSEENFNHQPVIFAYPLTISDRNMNQNL